MLDIELQPAAEDRVREWIATGWHLVDEGRPVKARREFERALDAVIDEARPPLLMAIARTHDLEGDRDAALARLKEAVLLAPRDATARSLLLTVGGSGEARQEISEWLEQLDRNGAAAIAAESVPRHELKALADRPRGRLRARLATSPLAARETLQARVGGRWLGGRPGSARDAEDVQLYVPMQTAPDGRYGLFVWISPSPHGHVTDRAILESLDARHLIWAGPDRAGNDRDVVDRLALALDAWHTLTAVYPIDPERVFVGGYSGGGRVASALAVCFPEVFRGGVLFMGANIYRPVPVPGRPGAHWPGTFERPAGDTLARARRQSRLVLVTGEFDFNRDETRALASAYDDDGFERVRFIELPGAGHQYGFRRDAFDLALDALEPAAR